MQAALKLVLEPIFEADFKPCSYGFRPKRRAHDAIAEIHLSRSRSYEWVLEGDITACFDEIDHTALMDRVRDRIGDKRVLGLVKAFLNAGILSEDGVERDTVTGTPQGGILSPAARQRRTLGPRRSFRRGLGSDRRLLGSTPSSAGARVCPPTASSAMRTTSWWWWPAPSADAEGAARTRWQRVLSTDRPTPVGREDEDRPHRRGLRLSRASASSGTRSEARRSATSTPTLRRRRLASVKAKVRAPTRGVNGPVAHRPLAPAQPGAARMDQLLPTRRVQGDLQLPPGLHLAPGDLLAAPQASPGITGSSSADATSPGGGRRRAR